MRLSAALTLILLVVMLTWVGQAFAQTAGVDSKLEQARQRIDAIQKQLHDDVPGDSLVQLRTEALDIAAEADQTANDLTPHLASLQARLAELGAAPATADATEPPDVAAQRASLTKSRDAVDGQIKLSKLLAVEGNQIAGQLVTLRRVRFQQALGERTASPLSRPFWSELLQSLQRDAGGMRLLGSELGGAAARAPTAVWLVAALVIAGLMAGQLWLDRLLLRLSSTRVPPGRLRRSAFALGMTLSGVLAPGLVAAVVYVVMTWAGPLYSPTDNLLFSWIGYMSFGGLVAGLGRALLSANRPSWRLMPLPDVMAPRLTVYPRMLAVMVVLLPLADRLATTVNASLETSVAVDCLFSLALGLSMAAGLVRGERLRRATVAVDKGVPAAARPLWLVSLVAASWMVLIFSLACLLAGYVAMGSFLVRQVAWVQIVAASTYLLVVFADDVFMAVLGMQRGPGGRAVDARADADDADATRAHAGPPQTPRQQAAVLLSALARVVLCLVAVAIVVAPFGEGPSELLQRADKLRDGLAFGEFNVRPLSVLRAGLVLVLGGFAIRGLQRWMLESYLPTTRVELGMHASVATLLGYAGGVVVFAIALAELGFSLERIAWLASALSVGIGFGLQAVVQNFVSGLILLAERPVKVGDWVSLGGAEGDIRRINVRATEIQLGDRSTVIVPNSEFITKTVRNVTRADPLGLLQIKFPMPLSTDAERVRELVLLALRDHPDVLDAPAPNVFLDGIEGGQLVFNANASVASPRQVYGVKSAILFALLTRLREAGLPMANPSTMVLRDVPAGSSPTPGAPASNPSPVAE